MTISLWEEVEIRLVFKCIVVEKKVNSSINKIRGKRIFGSFKQNGSVVSSVSVQR